MYFEFELVLIFIYAPFGAIRPADNWRIQSQFHTHTESPANGIYKYDDDNGGHREAEAKAQRQSVNA